MRLVFLKNHVGSFKKINHLLANGSYMEVIQNVKAICAITSRETEGSHKGSALFPFL